MVRIINGIAITIGIQRGQRTHHQDQAITPVSLNAMKSMARRPQKPMPPDDVDVSLIISPPCGIYP